MSILRFGRKFFCPLYCPLTLTTFTSVSGAFTCTQTSPSYIHVVSLHVKTLIGLIATLNKKVSTFYSHAKYLVKEQSSPVLTWNPCWNFYQLFINWTFHRLCNLSSRWEQRVNFSNFCSVTTLEQIFWERWRTNDLWIKNL